MFSPTATSGFKSTKSYRITNSDIIDSISASASMFNVDLVLNLLPVYIVPALKQTSAQQPWSASSTNGKMFELRESQNWKNK